MNTPEIAESWSQLFAGLLARHTLADAAHDPNHVRRVVTNARRLAVAEGADWRIVMPAAWLHDCVAVPKSSPDRRQASRLSALQAIGTMQTQAGKAEARQRTRFLRQFLAQLHGEIGVLTPGKSF